jgi:hypothetical protein
VSGWLRQAIAVALLAACGCRAAEHPAVPPLRPLPDASPPASTVHARAWRSEADAEPETYPKGTRHVEAGALLDGLRFNHNEYHLGPGQDAERRWDFAKVPLPDGTTLIGDSLNWHSGNRGYSPWSFLRVVGRVPGAAQPVSLLKPSCCIAAASFDGDDWAAAELVFERPLDPHRTVRIAVRLMRRAGDPWVYLHLDAEGGDVAVEGVKLHGYPNTTHPIYYGLVTQWPRNASFLLRERWVWAAGRDWNLHDRAQDHACSVAPDAPAGLLFYNRHNSETGGMMAVFLPEQVSRIDAAGTYGVSVGLGLRQPRLRLALREWYDWRGWEPVRDAFLAELPELVRRLRETSFAWPVADLLGHDASRATALLAAPLPAAEKQALRDALAAYDAAARRLRAVPVADTPERHAAERGAIVAAERVRAAMGPLIRLWLERGGVFQGE